MGLISNGMPLYTTPNKSSLKELKEGGLIEGTKEGRQIIYKLTPKGEEGLEDASRYFLQAFGDIAEDVKVKIIVVKKEDCDC